MRQDNPPGASFLIYDNSRFPLYAWVKREPVPFYIWGSIDSIKMVWKREFPLNSFVLKKYSLSLHQNVQRQATVLPQSIEMLMEQNVGLNQAQMDFLRLLSHFTTEEGGSRTQRPCLQVLCSENRRGDGPLVGWRQMESRENRGNSTGTPQDALSCLRKGKSFSTPIAEFLRLLQSEDKDIDVNS